MHGEWFILTTMLLLGLRHGIDHDHVAAIADLTALQRSPGRAIRLGMTYAVGHAIVLSLLGGVAVALGAHLPPGWEFWRDRVMGAALVGLGVFVLASLILHRRGPGGVVRIPSRATILAAAIRRLVAVFGPPWRKEPPMTADGQVRGVLAARSPAFLMGIVHGVGAETPSQLLMIVVAAGLGRAAGFAAIAAFIAGLLFMNLLMCTAFAGIHSRGSARGGLSLALAGTSAAYSVVVGIMSLAGSVR